MAALLVHVEYQHALAAGGNAEVLELAGLQVVGEQVAARVRLVARGRDAHGFLALDDAIDADVRGEVELAIGLDEVDMALALGDGLAALFATGLGEITKFFDPLRLGVKAEHPGALINVIRAEHVIDSPVAAGAHGVIAVMAEGEAGVVRLGGDLLALVGHAIGDDELLGSRLGAVSRPGYQYGEGQDEREVNRVRSIKTDGYSHGLVAGAVAGVGGTGSCDLRP